jgi:arylsulfatase A-like enzyme
MELYAAMLDNLDRNVGRLLDYLRANDLYDDTLIVFMSDNGAAGEDFFNVGRFRDFLHANYDNSYENMGHASSWVSYGPQWAEAGSAPYKRYKGFTTEGGIVAPMIMAGAGLGPRHGISHEYLTVTDLAPTFLELARARYPIDKAPMTGESLWPYLSGQSDTIHDSDFVTVLYHAGRSFLRQGDWKIVNIEQPFDEGHFALYNVVNDPGETTDLSAMEPERRTALIALWRAERRKLGIVLPEDL